MKSRLKRILSIALTLSLIWGIVGGIAPVRSYADGEITFVGPENNAVFHILSGTTYGSSANSDGALVHVTIRSEGNITYSASCSGDTSLDNCDIFRNIINPDHEVEYWYYIFGDGVPAGEYTLTFSASGTFGESHISLRRDYTVIAVDKHTITFDPNGGNVEQTTAYTNEYEKLASLPNATREGYELIGWFTDAEGGQRVTTSTVFEGDNVEIYAQWRVPQPVNPQPSQVEEPEADGLEQPMHRDNIVKSEEEPPADDPNSYDNFQKDTNKTLDNMIMQLGNLYNANNAPGLLNLINKGLTIDAGNWQSFKEDTYKKLDTLSAAGIPVTIKYTYNNKAQSVTIPGNLPISLTSLCKNGYCGFEYLRGQMNMYAALGFSPTASTAAVSSSAGLDSIAPAGGNAFTAAQVSAILESALAENPTSSVLDVNFGNASSFTADSLIALCEKNQVDKRIHFTLNGMKYVLFVPAVDPTSASYQQCKALLDAEPGKKADPIRLSKLFAPVGFSTSGE